MLTDTELLLCPSSSSIECLLERGTIVSVGWGYLKFCASLTITLSSVSMFLTPSLAAGRTGNDSVCHCGCRTVVSHERCDGNV